MPVPLPKAGITIPVNFSVNGAPAAQNAVNGVGNAANNATKKINNATEALNRFHEITRRLRDIVFFSSATLYLTRLMSHLSDEFTLSSNRLFQFYRNANLVAEKQKELIELSNRTRTAFASSAEIYTRTALSTRELGLSEQDRLDIVETLNNSVLLSGATQEEATNGLIQFSQALSAGRLAGDELRAVLEQLSYISEIIAKDLNVDRAALRELGAQGKLTSDILVRAVLGATAKTREEVKNTTVTLGQAFTILRNSIVQMLGTTQSAKTLFSSIADLLVTIARNIETVTRVLVGGGIIIFLNRVYRLILAIQAVKTFPFVFFLTTAIGALATFSSELEVSAELGITLEDVFVSTFSVLLELLQKAAKWLLTLNGYFGTEWRTYFDDFKKGLASVADFLEWLSPAINEVMTITITGIGLVMKGFANLGTGIAEVIIGIRHAWFSAIEAMTDIMNTKLIKPLKDWYVKYVKLAFGINPNSGLKFGVGGKVIGGPEDEDTPEKRIAADNAFAQKIRTLLNAKTPEEIDKQINEALTGAEVASAAAAGGLKSLIEVMRRQGVPRRPGTDDTEINGFLKEIIEPAAKRAIARREKNTNQRVDTALARDLDSFEDPFNEARRRSLTEVTFDLELEKLQARQDLLRLNQTTSQSILDVEEDALKIYEKTGDITGQQILPAKRKELLDTLETNRLLELRRQIYRGIVVDMKDINDKNKELQKLQRDGDISQEQRIRAERKNKIDSLEKATDVLSGFERGYQQVLLSLSDFASQAERTVVNAFQTMEDQVVKFVQTGKFSFSSLVDSILADLTRLLYRQALSGLLGAGDGNPLFGLLGALGGGSPAPLAAAGGAAATPGKGYLVGERGPELFYPTTSGRISPKPIAQGGGSGVNLSVVNVLDPAEITAAISSPSGEQAIVNSIQRNRRTVRRTLGG
jgi:tape measure domain-containing protein